jgi:hypothetical protein
MIYTTLGKTNLRVSVAGLGTGGFSRLGLKTGKSEDEGRAAHSRGGRARRQLSSTPRRPTAPKAWSAGR